jgi:hypothetical protein
MTNTQNTITQEMIDIIKHFNATTSFDKVNSIESRDVSNLAVILKQYGAERIKEAFAKANNSRFLTGQKGFEWKASFGWIIMPNHIESILSGKYDDYKRASSRLLDISDSTLWNADEPKDPTHSRGFEDMFDNR